MPVDAGWPCGRSRENINPDNLTAAKKRQNKITEYRKMLLAWKAQGIITLAGYILGFPADTPDSIGVGSADMFHVICIEFRFSERPSSGGSDDPPNRAAESDRKIR